LCGKTEIVFAKMERVVFPTQPPVCSPGAKWDVRRTGAVHETRTFAAICRLMSAVQRPI
jgi:hypothetical protein